MVQRKPTDAGITALLFVAALLLQALLLSAPHGEDGHSGSYGQLHACGLCLLQSSGDDDNPALPLANGLPFVHAAFSPVPRTSAPTTSDTLLLTARSPRGPPAPGSWC